MNVFRRGKKTKDKENVDPFGEDMVGDAASSKMSRSLKRKNKNAPPPKQLEFNLASALPETNDFRTSLIMPGLSARFSMLKEQDDPNSLLGKASDDSVLFPKRASRLNLFNHNPLADIAETESLHSIPKPFAREDRAMSMSDGGYASDDGSVMTRSRPGEGNNLFGGRQKVYRGVGANGQGRHLYEDDVALSPYQQWRLNNRGRDEENKPETDGRSESAPRDSEEADRVHSPMAAFSKNRGTTSSTMSGPSNRRTSTAATSVATCDSPIPRQNSGHGTGSKIRTSDTSDGVDVSRNLSSNSHKESGLREPAAQPPMPSASPIAPKLSQSKSAANLKERYHTASPVFSTFRANSPPPPVQPIAPLPNAVQEVSKAAQMNTRRYQTASPTNQMFEDDGDNVYSNNVHANDRGKATAMGLFNRPRQQFDEQQFLQRQRQMHEGRSSPMKSDTPDRVASPEDKPSAMSRIDNASSALSNHKPLDRQSQDSQAGSGYQSPYLRNFRNVSSPMKPHESSERMRAPSNASSVSAPSHVKARVESLIRRQNAELNALETIRSPRSPPEADRKSIATQSSNKMPHSPFLNRFDSSDDEEDNVMDGPVAEPEAPSTRFSRPKIAPGEVHPALRDGIHDFDFGEQVSPRLPKTMSFGSQKAPSLHLEPLPQSPIAATQDDSPTLGPNGLGLSGMIRTHLRHDSDRSSFYPQSPATDNFHLSRTSREMSMVSTSNTINPPESVHSDPWEFDNAHRHNHNSPRKNSEPPQPIAAPTMSQKAQQILGHAAAQRSQAPAGGKPQQILGEEAPNSSAESILLPRYQANSHFDTNSSNETVNSRPWQDDHNGHQRNASTETQKERQDFDAELAERRKRIQEGLKGIAERDRSMSPGPGRMSNEQRSQPFPSLRHKTSKGAVAEGHYSQKAMKMLGLNGGAPASEHHRPPPRHYNSSDNEYDEPPRDRQWGRGPGNRPPPAPSQGYHNASGRRTPHDGYSNGRRTPADGRRTPADGRTTPYANSSNEDFERARQRSNTPNSGRGYGRDRAGSEAAERSKSRTRQYRDDDGHGPPAQFPQGTSPPSRVERHRSDDNRRGPSYERSSSAMSGSRARSNSRPGPPPQAYFDGHAPPAPVMTSPFPGNGALPPQEREGMMPPPMVSGPGGISPAIGAPRPSPRPPMGPPGGSLGLPASPMPSPFPGMPSPAVSSSSAFPPSPAPPTGPLPAAPITAGRTTPSTDTGRATPGGTRRRMTVNKNMISEPTFVSSTSSVPLVGLPIATTMGGNYSSPNLSSMETPPLPAMNPRRRGGGADSPALGLTAPPPAPYGGSHSAQPSPSFGMPNNPFSPMPSSALDPGPAPQGPPPRARQRLRKISSEGGGMASKARQQALASEFRSEVARTPTVGTFARNGTPMGMNHPVEGGMF